MWINCLAVAGAPIFRDERVGLNLFQSTIDMLVEDQESADFKTDFIEGRITTQGKYACVGSLSGQMFHAEVETNAGRASVNYFIEIGMLNSVSHLRSLDEAKDLLTERKNRTQSGFSDVNETWN